MTKKEIEVKELGYPQIHSVASLRTIAQLFGTSKNRCGVYLLEFPDSVFYIGQAIDVVKRFSQHRQSHSDIIGFSFLKHPRRHLDEIERSLIHKAEKLGFVLSNTVHATHVLGDTDLDLVVSPKEQKRWLKSPVEMNRADESTIIELPDNMIHRTRDKYEKMKKRENYDAAVDLLKTYTDSCVPLPRRTEYSFWSLSCLPSTNKSTWPRLATVNMSVMEVFVIGYNKGSENELWGFVNVASDILFGRDGLMERRKFRTELPFVSMSKGRYKDGGQYQITLKARGENNIRKLINNKSVQNAAAHFNLRLMRKRPTIYSKYHCSDLAKQLVA